ncbi:MAG TPA: RDD family protein [Thermoanaerobaculia bacterium]|nr:RDD family protein [Thermoanaerobaculia bacterium]
MTDSSQTTLLRVAAFLVDALSISVLLILPASIVSYAMAWIGGSVKAIQIVWYVALGILMICVLLRDGRRGRSMGKRLLGLRLLTPRGEGCGYGRSIVRNLPLVLPPWNLLEAFLVVLGRARTGDRIAKTQVTEE